MANHGTHAFGEPIAQELGDDGPVLRGRYAAPAELHHDPRRVGIRRIDGLAHAERFVQRHLWFPWIYEVAREASPVRLRSVTAPSEAELTRCAYLARSPRSAFGARRRPASQPLVDLVLGDLEVDGLALGIDDDPVAILDDRNRAADGGFRRHVADHEPVAAAREAAVGNQRDFVAETTADDGARRAQHLAHARRSLRALVTNHEHVAGGDGAVENCPQRIFLRMKDARATGEARAFLARNLRDGAFGCEIAVEDREMAIGLQRLVEAAHDVLARRVRRNVGEVRRRRSRRSR